MMRAIKRRRRISSFLLNWVLGELFIFLFSVYPHSDNADGYDLVKMI